jgi:polyhydroxyalkanoate synthesis regulator phasin
MLKHKNAKKALLDIIEEMQKSQKDIEEKKSVFISNIPVGTPQAVREPVHHYQAYTITCVRCDILLAQLSEKFGLVPETTSQKVQSIESKEELDRLLRQLIHANSIEEMGLDDAKK